MKATLDLPSELIKEMKLRAVHTDRSLKEVVAETIRRGLAAPEPPSPPAPRKRVQIPIFHAPPGAPKFNLTGEDIDRILIEQEIQSHREAAGH